MAELEPGNPDELIEVMRNWLNQADSSLGSLPNGMDKVEWAVRQFINYWKAPTIQALDEIDGGIEHAISLCRSGGNVEEIAEKLDDVRQMIDCDLKDHLGLTQWHRK